jgi:hypothetical protein
MQASAMNISRAPALLLCTPNQSHNLTHFQPTRTALAGMEFPKRMIL